ncbi:hypothetical protein Sked_28730 [Sanguibacter keddieii DSM 10542]|uniref:Uncharacterized protein n=2 Tax=Sanguibacter keddieii TaxID=60920 RepID=D1BBK4_SANKS|nr:hypothetical protein Sked_28730 [Sanguibacter keddieii DSM 10542]
MRWVTFALRYAQAMGKRQGSSSADDLERLLDEASELAATVDGAALSAEAGLAEALRALHALRTRNELGQQLGADLAAAQMALHPGRAQLDAEQARALAMLQQVGRARDLASGGVTVMVQAIAREHGTSAALQGEVARVAHSSVLRWIKDANEA